MGKAFDQNIIALIWDFDKTLAKDYMQKPIFNKYNINEKEFWEENNSLIGKYQEKGIRINKDTVYLNHFLTCVEQGIFPNLNNQMLRNLGKEIQFYEGLPSFFSRVKSMIENDEKYKKYHITVEHYIVSTGLVEMIKGSKIIDFVDDVWGCEFIEEPIKSNLVVKEYDNSAKTKVREIKQVAYALDNTSKTKALFEINKGANKHKDIDVNVTLPHNSRRIPFENMIYIADGPSDVPAFSIVKKNKGKTFAVYPKGEVAFMKQVENLREENRIDMYGEADYREGTLTYHWITEKVRSIADKIYVEREDTIKRNLSTVPGHII
ncbi:MULTISPECIES: haloacid dehalogenase-like hydrolase [Bacillaceae]|uniref:Haloacid dehalogenase-like hydrolase n=1 Tax=Evansella alkalicola TaxID=745819 RepID=A0ABS6JXG8_9BACI|nr:MULTISPECIES: haloacid dehalogenase-like hydrolase [Bacillaceae]MBU9723274.1 hypothetical protein [Bacillus alkalicola]